MFSESLKIELTLRINDKKFNIPGGSIKSCELNLHTCGFDGRLGFGVFSDNSKDELFPRFVTHDLITVDLSVTLVHTHRGKIPDPIKITAYVTKKSVRESVYTEVKKEPVIQRYYDINFQDIPAVLWKQHFPVKLYTDKKAPDVLKDQVVEGISLAFDLSRSNERREMIFLGLEKKIHAASFYDFLIWYVHALNLVFFYDYKDVELKLQEKKLSPEPEAVFRPGEVESMTTYFPESLRYNTRILNAHSEEHKEIELSQKHAVQGVFQDIVMRTALEKEFDKTKKLETEKLENPLEEIEMTLKAFPAKFCTVGTMVKFEKEHWSKNNLLSDKNFRIFDIHLSANARDPSLSEHYNAEHAAYDMDMIVKMEREDNPLIHLPPFKAPFYPVLVEGKIVSESGDQDDKTYQIYNNEETSQDCYTVHVPLWDLKVKAPFIPNVFSGHFYFPAFKHARVILALYFDRAEIINFLDWGEGSRLPMDTQGNHILFGKNKDSKTSMKYLYSEGKPVFTIKRTSDTETEMIRMEEESIIFQTKDDE